MFYKLSDDGLCRTEAYRGTVTSKDDASLLALKADIARGNKETRELGRSIGQIGDWVKLLRVSLMARGTRRDDSGKLLHGNADSSLRHSHADYFDVYVHEDNSSMYDFKRELDLGLTPGELRKYDELQYQVRTLEWAW